MFKRLILTLAGISLLAGCGGGSGDGASTASVPAAYTGSTSQATISTSNAKTLSADAYAGSQLSSAVSIGKAAAEQSGRSALLQQTAGILESSVASIVGAHKSSTKAAAAVVQDTVYGYRGSISFSMNLDQTSGAFNGTLTFSQYKSTSSDSTSLSGTVDFSGVYSRAANAFISMTMSNIRLTGTGAGESYTLSGSMTSSAGGTTKTVTMSIVLSDNLSSRTYWMKDFTFTLSGNSLTITGTYYDHVHGYVVISTITPLTALSIDAAPTSGQLLFTGSNGTKARLTFTSGIPTVEADTSGTGTYVVIP